jgi:sugar fermentation stimulation protein A
MSRSAMRLPQLQPARLLRRYKRFLADVVFEDGREATVHTPNPGAMLGLTTPGLKVWISTSAAKTRKLPHTLEMVEAPSGALVDVNTGRPNALAAEAVALGAISELSGYSDLRREVRYGEASRVDLRLEGPHRAPCWVEVKGVTLSRRPGLAEWPDCVSARAATHVRELAARARAGDRAVVLFVVQRGDCNQCEVAADLDPAFAQALDLAMAAGVEVLAYGCRITRDEMALDRQLEFGG